MCRETGSPRRTHVPREMEVRTVPRNIGGKCVSKRAYFTPLAFRRVRTLTVNRSWIKLEFRSTMKLLKALSDFRS